MPIADEKSENSAGTHTGIPAGSISHQNGNSSLPEEAGS